MNWKLPPDPSLLCEARKSAEGAGDDLQLLAARELELAHDALPPVIDGARRSRLLHTDPIATTWEAWDTAGGHRMFLRCLRRNWRDDPVMLRRMVKTIGEMPHQHSGGISQVSWHPDGDWPHLRVVVDGALLADRFPVQDAPVTARMARILAGGLQSLAHIHDHGRSHGGPMTHFLVEGRTGAEVVWMDTFGAACSPSDDIADLASTVAELDPAGTDPVAELAREWVDDPPPTAADGIAVLLRVLGSHLLAARHRLAVAGRMAHKHDRATRLAIMVRRLTQAVPPPQAKVCLRATTDGVRVLAESDGITVRGGAAVDDGGRFLNLVFDPDQGLDAQAARYLLRAWATRETGDTDARMAAQVAIGATDDQADALVRWLSGMARLRAARMLLEAAHSPRRRAV